MANDLVPTPGRRSNGHGNGHQNGNGVHIPEGNQVYDPAVPAKFVDTDEQTAGRRWDLPPAEAPWEGFEAARQARRDAELADQDAEWGRRHGLGGYATLRADDAADNRQNNWDWGNFHTWAIIWAMFFGFLIFSALVYFLPHGRHNQNDGPMPTPSIHVYTCLKELPGL